VREPIIFVNLVWPCQLLYVTDNTHAVLKHEQSDFIYSHDTWVCSCRGVAPYDLIKLGSHFTRIVSTHISETVAERTDGVQ